MQRSVKVDFFSFTTRRSLAKILCIFEYLSNPLVPRERGLYGYHASFVSADGVTVLYSEGRPDIHVQMSGRGCDGELHHLVQLIAEGDTVTRLDIALDCIGSGFTCAEIWGYLRQGNFLSVSKDIRQCEGLLSRKGAIERVDRSAGRSAGVESLAGSSGLSCCAPEESSPFTLAGVAKTRTNSGHTIYIGASSSDRMVRIYDKGAESGTGADWLRFEVQLRRESANQFFLLGCLGSVEEFELAAMGMLNKQIRLIQPGQDEALRHRNYDRIKLLPFWEKLISKIEALKLKIPKPLKTFRSTMRYVKNSMSAIKMLHGVMPDFPEFINSVFHAAVLKPHHVAMQDDYIEATHPQPDQYDHFLRYQCAV